MKRIFLHLLLVAGIGAGARAQELAFSAGPWKEIMQKAREQHKPVFVDLYFEGCMPCKQMEIKTFKDKEVIDYMNENFISFRSDVFKEEEGMALTMRYAVSGFPTFLFINSEGSIIDISSGYTDSKEFLTMTKEAKAAFEKGHMKNYKAGLDVDLPDFYKDRYLHRDKKTELKTVISFLEEQINPDEEIPFLVMTAFGLNAQYNNYYFDRAVSLSQKYGRMVVRNKLIAIIKWKTQKLAAKKSSVAMTAMLEKVRPVFTAEEWKRFVPVFMKEYEQMAGD